MSENTAENDALAQEIWNTLNAVDCSKHADVKDMGNIKLTYLNWAWAWKMMMEHYPNTAYKAQPNELYQDGTMCVGISIRVRKALAEVVRTMWLPVLDHRNKPVVNPGAFDINTARMRCLVKCLAMLGLGAHIFRGQDLPDGDGFQPMLSPEDFAPDLAAVMQLQDVQREQAQAQQAQAEPAPPAETDAAAQRPTPSEKQQAAEVVSPEHTPQQQTQPQPAGDQSASPASPDQPVGDSTSITSPEAAEQMVETILVFAATMHSETLGSLVNFWKVNSRLIDYIEKNYPEQYKGLKNGFTEIKQAIPQE